MASAKDIRIKPIAAHDANRIVKSIHYSGKVTQNSQVHLGVFIGDVCGGAMQFGPSIDKRKTMGLVENTGWNNFIELNRMAFADWLPRNSESRALGWAMKWMRKTYSHIEWVISFADATQCGDGAIYRASGFVLTGIKENNQILRMPDGSIGIKKTLDDHPYMNSSYWRKRGARPLPGYQLRYVYFLNPQARERLTVPVLPFDEIHRRNAGMYLGKPRAGSAASGTPDLQSERGGATPTPALSTDEATP